MDIIPDYLPNESKNDNFNIINISIGIKGHLISVRSAIMSTNLNLSSKGILLSITIIF